MTLFTDTLRELARPWRAVPILLVAAPLVITQHEFSADKPLADVISLFLVGSFVLFGPYSWRLAVARGWRRFWPVVTVAPFAVGYAMSEAVEAFPTMLLNSTTGVMSAALFGVGSWGLGRDIELEVGLERMTERAQAATRAARASELLALQAHFDPHFLFNTLNAIAEWCVIEPERAEQAVLDLSAVLRTIMEGIEHQSWPLERELALVRQVLELHRSRDPDRFPFAMEVEKTDAQVPPLLLLPLVENAVTHGEGGVTVRVRADPLRIELVNPGRFTGERDGGRGLALVRDRLALAFGESARLEIGGDPTTAVVRFA